MSKTPYESEATAGGEQALVSGVAPVTIREELPFRAKKPQQSCDLGLFDEVARRQLSLFV
jgi:hypothetical protein